MPITEVHPGSKTIGYGLLIKSVEKGLFSPPEIAGAVGELCDLMVPKALRERLKPIHQAPHETAKRVPSCRLVIVNENHLAARDYARQQSVDDSAFALVGNFMKQEKAADGVIHSIARLGSVGDPDIGLGKRS